MTVRDVFNVNVFGDCYTDCDLSYESQREMTNLMRPNVNRKKTLKEQIMSWNNFVKRSGLYVA